MKRLLLCFPFVLFISCGFSHINKSTYGSSMPAPIPDNMIGTVGLADGIWLTPVNDLQSDYSNFSTSYFAIKIRNGSFNGCEYSSLVSDQIEYYSKVLSDKGKIILSKQRDRFYTFSYDNSNGSFLGAIIYQTNNDDVELDFNASSGIQKFFLKRASISDLSLINQNEVCRSTFNNVN